MKIGVIGSGRIGSVVGKLWARAGHQICFSSRHPEQLDALVKESGPTALRAPIAEALASSEVVLLSIPYASVADFGREHGGAIAGKVLLETGNPYPERDGEVAREVRSSGLGTGIWSQRWLPGCRLVRAFNSVWDQTLAREAHRPSPQIGIPLAGNDPEALEIASVLVRDAGFDPVIVGSLERAREFDVDTPIYNTNASGPEVRKALNLVG